MTDETREHVMTETDDLTTELPATTPPTEPTATTPTAEPTSSEARPTTDRRGPSVPTIVLGLLFAAVAAVVMVAQTTDADLNLAVTAPVALLVAGVVLVVWGVAGLGRARRTR